MRLRNSFILVPCLVLGSAWAPRDALGYIQNICTGMDSITGHIDICPNGPPTITNNGNNNGNVLAHPDVAPIFWGDYWTSNPLQRGQTLAYIQHFLNGPFLDGLREYGLSYGSTGGFSKARMSARAPIRADRMSAFTTQDVAIMVNKMIGANLVAPPRPGVDMVYTVFIEPGQVPSDVPANSGGYNDPETCTSDCGSYNGRNYTIAVIYSMNAFTQGSYAFRFTHELEEAITENLNFDCGTPEVTQISDICECHAPGGDHPFATFYEYAQPYWSAQQGKCVVPDSWFAPMYWDGAPNAWTAALAPSPFVQLATGDVGTNCFDPSCTNLVVMAELNKVYLYNADLNTWTDISPTSPGPQFSMLSVGDGWILGLNASANLVYRWDARTRIWTQLPALANGLNFTTIASGAFDIATDEGGSPWEYSGGAWVSAGTPGDQFVVGQNWAAKLAPGFEDVKLWPGYGSWIDLHHVGTELYIGGSQSLAIRDMTSQEGLLAMTTSFSNGQYTANPWNVLSSSAESSVALFGRSPAQVARLPLAEENIQLDYDPIGSGVYWDWIGPSTPTANHLIGHSARLLLTGSPHY
jgi:hypothetical protein